MGNAESSSATSTNADAEVSTSATGAAAEANEEPSVTDDIYSFVFGAAADNDASVTPQKQKGHRSASMPPTAVSPENQSRSSSPGMSLPLFIVSSPGASPSAKAGPPPSIREEDEEGEEEEGGRGGVGRTSSHSPSPPLPPLPLQSVEPVAPPPTSTPRRFSKSRRSRSEPPVTTPDKDELGRRGKEKRRSFWGSNSSKEPKLSANKENLRTPSKRSKSREPEVEPELDLAYVPPPPKEEPTTPPVVTANGLAQSENPLGEAQQREQRKQGTTQVSVFDIYEELVNAVIRPPRHVYDLAELGPKRFKFAGILFERDDFQLTNSNGAKFECSHWRPVVPPFRTLVKRPCYVMLHGNSSSRVVASSMLSFCLGTGASVFAFDFCGSGLSEGEFVTLGHNEQLDLQAVVAHLRETGSCDNVILWGRSMGASTALLYENAKDPLVACMILDSPFASINQLFTDFGNMVPNLSNWIKDILKWMLRMSISSRAGFNPDEVEPIENARHARTPALFVAGVSDNFVSPDTHLFPLHSAYNGSKQIHLVPGDHNSNRPVELFLTIMRFVNRYSTASMESHLKVDKRSWMYAPWEEGAGRPAL